MKALLIVSLCLSALLLAGAAHAFAVYNHAGYGVCAQKKVDVLVGSCDFTVPPNSTHNGAHGSGWSGRMVLVIDRYNCRGTDFLDIPDGGYARIYNDVVKIYKHDNNQVGSKGYHSCDCPGPDDSRKKP